MHADINPGQILTVYSVCDSELFRCQSSKRAKLYVPKSRNLADLPLVTLIKLINRQLSWLTGSLTCLRAFISVKQFNVFTRFYLS